MKHTAFPSVKPESRRLAAAIAALLIGPATAGAQTLTGRIFDATDSAVVSGAEVRVTGARRTRSNGLGEFQVSGLGDGRNELTVRMLGYDPFTDTVDVVAGENLRRDVYLVRVPHLLSQVTVKDRSLRVPSGFEDVYRRADMSNGILITREQIDSMNPRNVAGLVNQVGMFRVSARGGVVSSSRCQTAVGGGRAVTLYLNGLPLGNGFAVNELLEHLAPSSIQAVEFYNGGPSVPATFQPACGVVAVWTRRG